jgi:hypothetical protein
LLKPLEFELHTPAQLQIECREWLVEEKYLRLLGESASERDTLLLAT